MIRKKESFEYHRVYNTLAREAPSGTGFAAVGTRKWVQANSYSFAVGSMTDFDRSHTIYNCCGGQGSLRCPC